MTEAVNGVRFTEMEQIIFDALERAKGETVSVHALHDAMYRWGDAPQNWRSVVKVLVCRIRDKLDDATVCDRLIVTEWGRGYRLEMIKSEEAA